MGAKLCKQCHGKIKRGKKTWNEYQQRVFCSEDCKHAFERIDTPPHECAACGGPVVRRSEESVGEHAERKYCSRACVSLGAVASLPDRHCLQCGQKMERVRHPNGSLEGVEAFTRRSYCSAACRVASGTRGGGNSERQNRTRARAHRKDGCEGCGATSRLQVHHVDRDIEHNTPDNLQTLCHDCHVALHNAFDACGVETGLRMPHLRLDKFERLW